jgi:flagellar M-ring protein FliF
VNGLIQSMKNLGPTRLAMVGGVVVALLAFLIYIAARMGGGDTALLYGDLDPTDASRITARLDQMQVPYQLRADGRQVYVPVDAVSKARITLAGEGLPSGGNLGYEVFDKSEGLTSSSFVQNINQLRALEGEISRTINSMDGVRSSRVHLVLPQRELFSRDRQEPSASVVLKMNGTRRLDRGQITAIQTIIAASVPGLKQERIAIADDRGALLSRTSLDGANSQNALQFAEEMRIAFEDRRAREIEMLLERSLGAGKVRAQVSAQIDNARTNQNEEIYNPDQQVLRSTQNVTDTSEQMESDGNPSVTIANNLPPGASAGGGGITNSSKNSRTEETNNFEIGKITRQSVIEPGAIKRMTIAVMVDNATVRNEAGELTTRARTQQEMEKLGDLVRSAVGFDAQRGDTVEVVNLQFAADEDELNKPLSLFGMGKEDLMKLAEILVLGVVGVLVVLLVVRPLLTRLFEAAPTAASASAGAALLAGEGDGMMAQLTGPGGSLTALPGGEADVDDMIDLNRIEGRVKASTLRKIGELIDRNPEEVVSVIRNWLYQESGNN